MGRQASGGRSRLISFGLYFAGGLTQKRDKNDEVLLGLMSDTFITSDEHYGHDFIRKVKNRPFRDIYEMQEEMIARHNKKVPDSKNFLTIHAGDLFWRTLDPDECMGILNRLHGRHALVWGNHDDVIQESEWLQSAFEWCRDIHQLYFNKHRLTICHYAMRVWPKSHQGHWHVYGHSHQELPPQGLSFDIGVEGHNYEPWSLEEIESKMSKLEQHHVIKPEDKWEGK
jgi:calcineurin-like phosphoesterase family protein